MFLAYVSRTNNIERLIQKLKIINCGKIISGDEIIDREFILLTYTDMCGGVPDVVKKFLKKNGHNLRAVAGSGNKNFGENFCMAAKKISDQFQVELLACFELAGDEEKIKKFKQKFLLSGGY